MAGKVYLITGAGKGIGRGLFNHYAAQPGNTVIATVRNLAQAQSLLDQPKGENTTLLVTKVDSLSKTDPFTAVEDLRSRGVDRIDVVIANAGAAHHYRLSELPVEFFEETVAVNGTAVLLLYQATLPLLRAAAEASPDKAAKFALISSGVGSIAGFANVVPWNMGAYGASKALANYLVVKMAKETDFLVTLCLNPGYVKTDLAAVSMEGIGDTEEPISPAQCANNLSMIIDNATKLDVGKFFDGALYRVIPW